jgi:nitroimidazol reductase NimA-like FMN-containing flavoprotein (pyridoxamine 5'-phosphate oxidase superfamily)
MAIRELTADEIEVLLRSERLVRVAFANAEELFVTTLGYVWRAGRLYGVTSKGRKTAIAASSPRVAFQIDTSLGTGPYGWRSVAGEGFFSWVTDGNEAREAGAAMQGRFSDAPEWWRREQGARMTGGQLRFWSITPTLLTGRHDESPAQ